MYNLASGCLLPGAVVGGHSCPAHSPLCLGFGTPGHSLTQIVFLSHHHYPGWCTFHLGPHGPGLGAECYFVCIFTRSPPHTHTHLVTMINFILSHCVMSCVNETSSIEIGVSWWPPTVFQIINNVLRGVDLHIHERLDYLVLKQDSEKV